MTEILNLEFELQNSILNFKLNQNFSLRDFTFIKACLN